MQWLLYSSPRSPFVRKVMIAAHELGLDGKITCQDVITTPMDPAPELLGDNPLGMIPTLKADGETLFDSLVILQYMNDVAGGGLFPKTTLRECMTRHAMANGMTDKAVRILDEQFRAQNEDTAQHTAGFVDAIHRGIQWMEPRLLDGRFDAGDIAYAALMAYLDMRFPQYLWVDKAPRTQAFMQSLLDRPSMVATKFQTPSFV